MEAMESRTDQVFKLSDGRSLGYAEYGAEDGRPIFFFHGSQSSRFERHPDDSIAVRNNARVIVVDRPGHGLSDFQPGRTILDGPADIVELADGLGLDRFGVMGMSAGGPYALACGLLIPDRLPNRRAHFIPGAGHLMIFDLWDEILAEALTEPT